MAQSSSTKDSRVWLVTGCSSGFGLELVHTILKRGDRVIATARSLNKVANLKALGAAVLSLDVTSPLDQLNAIVDKAISIYGKIDVLVNNAGYVSSGAIEEISPEETLRQFNTNVFGALNTTRAVLPHMRSRKSGTIVFISSVGGMKSAPGAGIYCASKFAIEAIGESLRDETKHLGIDVTIVEPGYFRTNLLTPNNLAVPNLISDYEPSVGPFRAGMAQVNGNQPGDPKKGVQRIVDVVTKSNMAAGKELPERIALGTDAYHLIKAKCETTLKSLEEWRDLTFSTDFTQ